MVANCWNLRWPVRNTSKGGGMQWREGDFIIIDNLAVGHKASKETQLPRHLVGLRVMHRTTTAGLHNPAQLRLNNPSWRSSAT